MASREGCAVWNHCWIIPTKSNSYVSVHQTDCYIGKHFEKKKAITEAAFCQLIVIWVLTQSHLKRAATWACGWASIDPAGMIQLEWTVRNGSVRWCVGKYHAPAEVAMKGLWINAVVSYLQSKKALGCRKWSNKNLRLYGPYLGHSFCMHNACLW